MARRKSGINESHAVAKARRKFETWRRKRNGVSRIPKDLWSSAVVAAREVGVNQVCQALGLEYYALKKRVAASTEIASKKASDGFVELDTKIPALLTEWAVEMDNGKGGRLRVAARSVSGPDLAALSRTFFGEES